MTALSSHHRFLSSLMLALEFLVLLTTTRAVRQLLDHAMKLDSFRPQPHLPPQFKA